MFYTKTITRELKTIPFDKAFEIYEDARILAVQTAREICEQEFQDRIQKMEQDYTGSHEAPSEVSFADQVDYPTLDFREIGRKAGQKALIEEFIPRYKLETTLQLWVMPQIIRYIGDKNLASCYENGKIDGKKAVNVIFNGFGSDWDKGLYLFLMLDSRSSWLKSQYKGEARNYCSLVPLILYAYKSQHSIPYSEWSRDTLEFVVNKSLCDAMLCEVPELEREVILDIRELGLTYRSGEKKGEQRKAETTYKLYGIQSTPMGEMPELAQSMLAQIWCAHPVNRTKYMVLDSKDWDKIPTPLITTQIFATENNLKPKTRKIVREDTADLPWM